MEYWEPKAHPAAMVMITLTSPSTPVKSKPNDPITRIRAIIRSCVHFMLYIPQHVYCGVYLATTHDKIILDHLAGIHADERYLMPGMPG